MQVRARHARVQDVADDEEAAPAEVMSERLAQGEHVQQALGRVRVAAVAGIDQHGTRRGGGGERGDRAVARVPEDRKSTRLNSSHVKISYAVFCLKKKNAD